VAELDHRGASRCLCGSEEVRALFLGILFDSLPAVLLEFVELSCAFLGYFLLGYFEVDSVVRERGKAGS
jgi:hypothetical protein